MERKRHDYSRTEHAFILSFTPQQRLPAIIALRNSGNPSAYASGCCSWPRRGRRNGCQWQHLVAPCRGPVFLDGLVLPVERPRWGLFVK